MAEIKDGVLPPEVQNYVRRINASVCFHFPLLGVSFTFVVPFDTSYWMKGGGYLLFRAILEAKAQNPFYANYIERILDPETNPDREYAQVSYDWTIDNKGYPVAYVQAATTTDTRDPKFVELLKGATKTDDTKVDPLP